MSIGLADVIELGSYALKLRELIAERGGIITDIHTVTLSLLRDIEDLIAICKGFIEDSIPELDTEIFNLRSGLETLLDKFSNVSTKYKKRSVIGMAKSFINAKQIRRRVEEIDKEVNRLKQRFMIRTQIQQATTAAKYFADLREELSEIRRSVSSLSGDMMDLRESANTQCRTREKIESVPFTYDNTCESSRISYDKYADITVNHGLCRLNHILSRAFCAHKGTSGNDASEKVLPLEYSDASTQCEYRSCSDQMTLLHTFDPWYSKENQECKTSFYSNDILVGQQRECRQVVILVDQAGELFLDTHYLSSSAKAESEPR